MGCGHPATFLEWVADFNIHCTCTIHMYMYMYKQVSIKRVHANAMKSHIRIRTCMYYTHILCTK